MAFRVDGLVWMRCGLVLPSVWQLSGHLCRVWADSGSNLHTAMAALANIPVAQPTSDGLGGVAEAAAKKSGLASCKSLAGIFHLFASEFFDQCAARACDSDWRN